VIRQGGSRHCCFAMSSRSARDHYLDGHWLHAGEEAVDDADETAKACVVHPHFRGETIVDAKSVSSAIDGRGPVHGLRESCAVIVSQPTPVRHHSAKIHGSVCYGGFNGPSDVAFEIRQFFCNKELAMMSTAKITKHVPKVRMGDGSAPPRIVKHVPKVRMGDGSAPPQIVKHVPKVRMGDGSAPPRIVKHVR
jgi:hypothetical protein